MDIIKDHIPFSTPNNRRPNIKMQPNSITIHSTANPKSTAKNERGWLTNPSNKRTASWHYVVDEKDVIEAIPPDYVAWHATDGNGDGNMKSISVEMCESGNRELVIKRTQELVRHLMKKYNINKVVRHYDWYSAKKCPQILNNDGKWTDWHKFLNEINSPVEKKVEKVDNIMLKPSGHTLQKSVEYGLYRMELEGILQPKWRQDYLEGKLSQSDAIAILFHAITEGFVHNKYSNK